MLFLCVFIIAPTTDPEVVKLARIPNDHGLQINATTS